MFHRQVLQEGCVQPITDLKPHQHFFWSCLMGRFSSQLLDFISFVFFHSIQRLNINSPNVNVVDDIKKQDAIWPFIIRSPSHDNIFIFS